jgi:hypothetical protein
LEPGDGNADGAQIKATLLEAAVRAGVQAAEIGDHLATLFKIQGDLARWAARRAVVRVGVAALVLVGLAAVVATAGVRMVAGACDLLAAAFDGRPGAGGLLGGALSLVAVAIAIAVALQLRARAELAKKEAEYAELHREHERRFGPPASAPPAAK